MRHAVNRRDLFKAAAGWGLASTVPGKSCAADPIYLADMHYHLFFAGTYPAKDNPLGAAMAGGHATLVAWSFVSDLLWIMDAPRGVRQKAVPKPGELYGWFTREIARIERHVAEQNLKIVQGAADIDAALKGDPHVILATEGSFFLDGDLARLKTAYDLGVRHVQLVHYIKNEVGDFQTNPPEHQGLTEFGKKVVAECNRLGILIDLAHCTDEAVTQALAISRAPMIWSHGSIAKSGRPHWSMIAWKARQLTLPVARRIARKGGVVGLWALKQDVGASFASYAARLAEMADQLGEDHVGFGTDIHGLNKNQIFDDYADVRKVVEHWQKHRMKESRIRKIAIENYARVLKEAFRLRQT